MIRSNRSEALLLQLYTYTVNWSCFGEGRAATERQSPRNHYDALSALNGSLARHEVAPEHVSNLTNDEISYPRYPLSSHNASGV